MIKWKSTRQSKGKTDEPAKKHDVQDTEQNTAVVYHETLYSQEDASKNGKKQWRQQRWESSDTIERHVDQLEKTSPSSSECSSRDDVDKRIDEILLKKKKRI